MLLYARQVLGLISLLFILQLTASLKANPSDSERTLVIANQNVPESLLLAEFYRDQRGIPEAHVLHLDIEPIETIDYRIFVDNIWNPVREYLIQANLVEGFIESSDDEYGRNSLRIDKNLLKYIVICKGIPLKISRGLELLQFTHDEIPQPFRTVQASVDSELALILQNNPDPIGIIKNPNFEPPFLRFVDYRFSLAIGRIEGPTYTLSRRMILDAIEVERSGGLNGRAYVDLHSQHPLGNEWLQSAAKYMEAFGIDTDIESSDGHWSYTERHDAPALYLGWYSGNANGPAISAQTEIPKGAIGWHIHSLSAYSLADPEVGWVAPLLQNGYAVSFGNVEEPYLEYTQRPDIFIKYLVEGHTVGEASLYALPFLSWQTVMVGDPLYRPFPQNVDHKSTESPYAQILKINRLQKEDPFLAREYALNTFIDNPSIQLAYKILIEFWSGYESEMLINSIVRSITQLPQLKPEEVELYLRIAEGLHSNGHKADIPRITQYLRSKRVVDIRYEQRINALSKP